MIATLKFIRAAVRSGLAFVDVDGTLVKRFQIPADGPVITGLTPLEYWKEFLPPMPLIKRRLPLLYLLRALGVRLYVWTNRGEANKPQTLESLGIHARLFSDFLFFDGLKFTEWHTGPIMDDDVKYANRPGDLLVESL